MQGKKECHNCPDVFSTQYRYSPLTVSTKLRFFSDVLINILNVTDIVGPRSVKKRREKEGLWINERERVQSDKGV